MPKLKVVDKSPYLISEYQKAKEDVRQRYTAIIKYVKDHDLSDEDLIKAFLETSSLTRDQAKIEVSRIRQILKPKNADLYNQVQEGKIWIKVKRAKL